MSGLQTARDCAVKVKYACSLLHRLRVLFSSPGTLLWPHSFQMDLLDKFLDVSLSEIRHLLGGSCYWGDKDKCYIVSTLMITYSLIRLIIFPCHHGETWLWLSWICLALLVHFIAFLEAFPGQHLFFLSSSMECGMMSLLYFQLV